MKINQKLVHLRITLIKGLATIKTKTSSCLTNLFLIKLKSNFQNHLSLKPISRKELEEQLRLTNKNTYQIVYLYKEKLLQRLKMLIVTHSSKLSILFLMSPISTLKKRFKKEEMTLS